MRAGERRRKVVQRDCAAWPGCLCLAVAAGILGKERELRGLMKISLKPHHLKFYQQIAGLLYRYGRSDLMQDITTAELLDEKDILKDKDAASPEQLANDLEAMGPTFV